MKILTCTQQKEADAYTIANNNILSINLMEKAASLIADEILTASWCLPEPAITEEMP